MWQTVYCVIVCGSCTCVHITSLVLLNSHKALHCIRSVGRSLKVAQPCRERNAKCKQFCLRYLCTWTCDTIAVLHWLYYVCHNTHTVKFTMWKGRLHYDMNVQLWMSLNPRKSGPTKARPAYACVYSSLWRVGLLHYKRHCPCGHVLSSGGGHIMVQGGILSEFSKYRVH